MAPRRTSLGLGCLVVALVLVAAAAVAGFALLRDRGAAGPDTVDLPGQRCVATAGDASVVLDLEQARLTSIIVGLSVRRGLAARAASIAMATAYQESGIRNLDYGDRDSVGLFQQRPSQGWGTVEQLQDPYYATNAFYDALVRVDGWQTGDINDVAQAVQRSGFPEAYRDHEADGRVLASVLTGHSRAGLTCLERGDEAGDADALAASMQRSLGTLGTLQPSVEGSVLSLDAGRSRTAWAYAHHAVANAARYGVTAVSVGDRHWQADGATLPDWTEAAEPLAAGRVSVSVRD